MNPTHQKKKPNTVKVVLIMVFVIFLGISALLIWNAANARLAQKLTEIQVSDEDADKISYEIDDEKIHVLTPYYSFDLPISWLGYCSLDYEPMEEDYDWSDCYYVFSDAQHDPDTYRITIRYQDPRDMGDSCYLGKIALYNELFNYGNFLADERDGGESTRKYYGRLEHAVGGKTYYAHMAVIRASEHQAIGYTGADKRCVAMYYALEDVYDTISAVHSESGENKNSIEVNQEWRSGAYTDEMLEEYVKTNEALHSDSGSTRNSGSSASSGGSGSFGSSGNSSSSGSTKYSGSGNTSSSATTKTDGYDVEDYEDPDDFADEWVEEFSEYDEDEDDAYDEAYDYWKEHHE